MEKRPPSRPARARSEYVKGIEAGGISGLVWGGVVTLVFYINVSLNMGSIVQAINQEQAPYTTTQTINTTLSSTTIINSVTTFVTSNNITGGLSPSQYVLSEIPDIAASYILIGLIFGAVIGLIFSAVYPRYLMKSSLPIRAIVLALIFWVLYLLSLVESGTSLVGVLSSLATSLVAGYALGFIFQKLGGGAAERPKADLSAPNGTVTSVT
jgi:hypothetical protein